jgi:hypothetical protein
MRADASSLRVAGCPGARRLLQGLHDADRGAAGPALLPPALAAHLETCASCRGFARFLDDLAPDVSAAFDAPLPAARAPVVRRAAARARPSWARVPVLVPALAAALAVAVGVPLALAARERAANAAEAAAFVRDLYASAPLDGVEIAAAGPDTGVLDDLGAEPWLAPLETAP